MTRQQPDTPAIPTELATHYRLCWIIIVGFVGGFLLWSIVTSLASGVLASGSIKVDSNRKQIQHVQGGIVSEILVQDGDRVTAGQVLVRLDKTQAETTLARIQHGLDNALAQQARLHAEQQDLPEISFPASLQARSSNPDVHNILTAQQRAFTTRKATLQGQLDILDQQIRNHEQQIKGLRAQQQAKEQQITSTKEETSSLRRLFEKGMVDRTRLLMLERSADELGGEVGDLVSQMASVRLTIGETTLEQLQLKKTFQEKISSELKEIQAQVNDYKEQLVAAQHVLDHTELKSPVDGTVVGLGVHSILGVIAPGAVVMELVPDHDNVIIEAAIDPKDIDNVGVGQQAGIKFSAFNQREIPEIAGHVIYVAADSTIDDHTGLPFYTARVAVEEAQRAKLQGKHLQPGMMADVIIRTGSKKPIDYLLEPLITSFRKAWLEE